MIARVLLLVTTGGGLLVFGVIAWIQAHPGPVAAAPSPTESVLVAAHPVDAGSLLKPEDITAASIPASEGANAILDTPENRSQLRGSMVRRALAENQRLALGVLVRPADHGFLAAVLDPGMRAMTIGLDQITSDASLIWPGDRVDILLVRDDMRGLRSAAYNVSGETVLTNVRVIAVDEKLIQGMLPGTSSNQAHSITVETSPEDAPRLAVALHLGKLSLLVRSSNGVAKLDHAPHRIVWAGDVSKASEPAQTAAPAATIHQAAIVHILRGAQSSTERF